MFFLIVIFLIIPLVISVAFYTLTERKIIAAIQRRFGPNIVGPFGTLQAFADGLKAILKEQIKPTRSIFYLFIFSPILTFILSLFSLNFICFSQASSYFDECLNFYFFFSISCFGILGIIFAGWTSNSKYSLLGSLRAAAQTFSFEMCFITLLLPIFLLNSNFNFIDIVINQINFWNFFVFFTTAIFFFIVILAETNRTPFDLPEAEAELVAGFNLEYSAINFALFFLAEYTNMLLNSAIYVIFFLGGWLVPFLKVKYFYLKVFKEFIYIFFFNFKLIFISILFILVRAILPRYRFDQLMDICWKKILPISGTFFLFFIFFIYFFQGFQYNLEIDKANPKFLTYFLYLIN